MASEKETQAILDKWEKAKNQGQSMEDFLYHWSKNHPGSGWNESKLKAAVKNAGSTKPAPKPTTSPAPKPAPKPTKPKPQPEPTTPPKGTPPADRGSESDFLRRWGIRKAQGQTYEQFVASYNESHGTAYTVENLKKLENPSAEEPEEEPDDEPTGAMDGVKGSLDHMVQRWGVKKAQGMTASEFLEQYNQNFGTNFQISDIPNIPGEQQPPTDAPDRNAYAALLETLNEFGLGELSSWLWNQIVGDVPEAEIFINLRQTDAYKRRFPGMDVRRQKGLRALSEAEYIRNEEGYKNVLRSVGADPGKYDNPTDFLDYFSKDISVEEAGERAEIWRAMTKAPQTTARIKGMFKQYAGMTNVTDEQLFEALVERDADILTQLHTGLTHHTAIQNLSVSAIREYADRAIRAEAATFRSGGGSIASQQGVNVGLVGRETESFA